MIGGIELAEIKKGQFKLGKSGQTATMPEIWQAALAAKQNHCQTRGPGRPNQASP
jgi:hypothetical protein